MKIKHLDESFELVKPEEEIIDTVEVVEETLTEASETPWDKLVKAYPELTVTDSDNGIIESTDTVADATEQLVEEKDPYDKLVDAYPELEEAINNLDEYDDQYEFDNEDDIVEQDRMHAALYGGDREYCDKCGNKLVMDEWGGSCPKCNSKEIFNAKYDDDVSYFDDETLDEAKEKVSDRAKEILSPLTMSQAIKAAKEVLADNLDCDGVCYGIDNDYFQPYCITFDEAQRIALKQEPRVLWNRNK